MSQHGRKKFIASPVLSDVINNKYYEPVAQQHQLLLHDLTNNFGIKIQQVSKHTNIECNRLISLETGALKKISLREFSKLLCFYCHVWVNQQSNKNNISKLPVFKIKKYAKN